MRTMKPPVRLGSQEGAVAPTVALLLLAIFGMGAISVDLGSLWQTKRNLVVDTDAAALAAAAATANSCDAVAADQAAIEYLGYNDTGHQDVDVDVDCEIAGNVVTVSARKEARLTFAPVLGFDTASALSRSAAQVGPAASGTGARPLAVCLSHPAVASWIATGDPGPFTLMYSDRGYTPTRSDRLPDVPPLLVPGGNDNLTSGCAAKPGNWGLTCFATGTPGTCGASVLEDYILDGYPREIDLGSPGDPFDGDCDASTSPEEDCNAAPGVRDSLEDDFATLHCEGASSWDGTQYRPAPEDCDYRFSILGVESLAPSGDYPPTALLGVVLRDSYIKGNRFAWFTFEFTNILTSGRVGPGHVGGLKAVNLCGADHDPAGGDACTVRILGGP